MKTFWERVQGFFVSILLIPASHVLDIYQCLGFKGEKDDILVSGTVCSSQGIIFIAVNLRTSLHLSENMRNS